MKINVNKNENRKIVANVQRKCAFGGFSKTVAMHVHICDVVCEELGTYWYGFVPPEVVSVGDARGD